MRCLTTVFGSNGARTPLMCLACLTALGIGHVFPNSGLGAENEGVDKPKSSVSERTTNSDKGDREKNDQSGGDDSVRHHAVLGVSLTKSAEGNTVVGVIPDSAAERAGLRMGVEIRHVGDQRIHTIQEMTDEILASKPGTQIDLLVRRNGQRLVVSAKLGSQASTSGTRDRRPQYSQSYSNIPATRSVQPVNQGRAPSSYNAATGQTGGREQQLNQQIRALHRQVYLLNQQVFQMRSLSKITARTGGERYRRLVGAWATR